VSVTTATTQDDLRRLNLARILRFVHVTGPVSRSDLVGATGMNRSTIGVLVNELAEAGLVAEVAGAAGGVGRPSLVAEPVPSGALVLACEVKVEATETALVGLGGKVFTRRTDTHAADGIDPAEAVEVIAQAAEALLGEATGTLVGLAVSIPGVIDPDDGQVLVAPNLGWRDVPLGTLLVDRMTVPGQRVPPIAVGNDADLGALAEHVRGSGRGVRSLIYLSGEVGIGGGIVLDGNLMTGLGGFGGEVGHMVVNPGGLLCRCGTRGCWETEIGRDAVLRAAGLSDEVGDVLQVVRAAESGNAKAREGLRHVGEWLGLGLGNLVNIFNPEVIVLGGHLRYLLPQVSEAVLGRVDQTLAAMRDDVQLVTPALEGDSTLLGAAERAFAPLLADPLGVLQMTAAREAS